MVKDRQLHDKLGIPIQTLKNWKSDTGYKALLYRYLTHQNSEKFIEDAEKIASVYEYDLLTPKELSSIVEQNWEKFDIFDGYDFSGTVNVKKDDEIRTATVAYNAKDSSILLIRYIYAVRKKKELFFDEVERMVKQIKEIDLKINSFQLFYVTTTHNPPKYFNELKYDVRLVNYGSLYEKVSNKHLLIV